MKLLLGIALCIVLSGCAKPRATVFVVPDEFRGRLVLVIIKGLPTGYEIVNDTYVYRFPESGVLCIGHELEDIVVTWHQNSARYESGAEIPRAIFEPEQEEEVFDDVRFGLLGDIGTGYTKDGKTGRFSNFQHNEFWAVVGSSSEIKEANNEKWSSGPRHAIEYCLRKEQ